MTNLTDKKPVLALFAPNKDIYSETFILAHRQFLNADLRFVYGGWRPQFSEQKGALVPQNLPARVVRRLENFFSPNDRLTTYEKAVVRFLKEEKIEAVLAEYGITAANIYRACQAAGVPLIVHFHGMDAYQESTLKKMLPKYQGMFEYADSIIGVSRHMCAQLIKLGAPPEKIIYNPYGPNPSFLAIQPEQGSRTLVAVGRFIPKKAPDVTIRAFAKAAALFPDLRLRMGGNGQMLDLCQNLARELNIADKIEFAGPIRHDEVVHWFSHALAFVQHSVNAPGGDTEGTPVVVLEASAAGLPVVSTRHAGIPDVIAEGETGILVDEHDLEGFAQAIIKIAGDPALAAKMGAAGRRRIREHFTLERHIQSIDKLVRKAIPV